MAVPTIVADFEEDVKPGANVSDWDTKVKAG